MEAQATKDGSLADRSAPEPETITRLLEDLRAGDRGAFDRLLPLVYDELHRAARRQRGRWQGDETMNATALVHEAYLRLVDQPEPRWQGRAHFLAVASRAMRQILLDYAKRRSAVKRGRGRPALSLDEIESSLGGADSSDVWEDAVAALDRSLDRLESLDPRQGRIVECRFFGDMTIEDTAEALGISPATVKRGWAMAQAWLYRDLKRSLGDAP